MMASGPCEKYVTVQPPRSAQGQQRASVARHEGPRSSGTRKLTVTAEHSWAYAQNRLACFRCQTITYAEILAQGANRVPNERQPRTLLSSMSFPVWVNCFPVILRRSDRTSCWYCCEIPLSGAVEAKPTERVSQYFR